MPAMPAKNLLPPANNKHRPLSTQSIKCLFIEKPPNCFNLKENSTTRNQNDPLFVCESALFDNTLRGFAVPFLLLGLNSAIHFPGLVHPGFEDCGSQRPETNQPQPSGHKVHKKKHFLIIAVHFNGSSPFPEPNRQNTNTFSCNGKAKFYACCKFSGQLRSQ